MTGAEFMEKALELGVESVTPEEGSPPCYYAFRDRDADMAIWQAPSTPEGQIIYIYDINATYLDTGVTETDKYKITTYTRLTKEQIQNHRSVLNVQPRFLDVCRGFECLTEGFQLGIPLCSGLPAARRANKRRMA